MSGNPPASFRLRLLDTPPDSVSPAVIDAARRGCAADDEIAAAYVCSAVRQGADGPGQVVLLLGLKVNRPISTPSDLGETPRRIVRDFWTSGPELRGAVELTFIADRAETAWKQHGVLVYTAEMGHTDGP